jgi:hypothetical protein
MQRKRMGPRAAAVTWVLIPPLVLSALIHSVDPDVGGLAGFTSPFVLLSVLICASPFAAVALVCLGLAIRGRWRALVCVSGILSAILAMAIVRLQSPHSPGLAESVPALVGGTVVVWLLEVIAVLPAWALGWSTSKGRRRRGA